MQDQEPRSRQTLFGEPSEEPTVIFLRCVKRDKDGVITDIRERAFVTRKRAYCFEKAMLRAGYTVEWIP
jgi:hypothetical protein